MKHLGTFEIKNPPEKLLAWIERTNREREDRLKKIAEGYEDFKRAIKESEKED